MAEKKKMSVAEILAAARNADSKGAAAPASKPPAVPKSAAQPQALQAAAATQESVQQEAEQPAAAPAPKPKPAPGGAKPSVAEVLAMARAGAKGGQPVKPAAAPKPAAEVKPAKPAPAEKPAAVSVSAGAKDTASILAAARKTTRPGPMSKAEAAARLKSAPERPAKAPAAKAPAAKAPAAVPPMPRRPDYARPRPAKDAAAAAEDRRWFLSVALGSFLGIGFTSLATTFGLWTLGLARFMFPNILTEPPSRFKVGFPSDFPPGAVEEKFKALFGVWVVNAEYQGQPQIFALRTVCTHLGCTPNWLDAEQKFKCPCHGSGFYKDGINFEGPAPRPLERYAISLADDGQLEVDKSKLFQEEMGQWSDSASFVPV